MSAADYYDELEELLSMELRSMKDDRNSLAHPVLSPKRRLFDILDNSSTIRNALMKWINDCNIFHKQTGAIMDKFYNEIHGRHMI